MPALILAPSTDPENDANSCGLRAPVCCRALGANEGRQEVMERDEVVISSSAVASMNSVAFDLRSSTTF